ncbi:MAG: hypothetical protein ACI9SY_000007 [Candidatus Paceibacteria bacterium]|jgi:hypothetical protein
MGRKRREADALFIQLETELDEIVKRESKITKKSELKLLQWQKIARFLSKL